MAPSTSRPTQETRGGAAVRTVAVIRRCGSQDSASAAPGAAAAHRDDLRDDRHGRLGGGAGAEVEPDRAVQPGELVVGDARGEQAFAPGGLGVPGAERADEAAPAQPGDQRGVELRAVVEEDEDVGVGEGGDRGDGLVEIRHGPRRPAEQRGLRGERRPDRARPDDQHGRHRHPQVEQELARCAR